MRDASNQEEPIFLADLYSGNKIETTVYLDRTAMLRWVSPLAPAAALATAVALDLLMRQPTYTIIDVPLQRVQ